MRRAPGGAVAAAAQSPISDPDEEHAACKQGQHPHLPRDKVMVPGPDPYDDDGSGWDELDEDAPLRPRRQMPFDEITLRDQAAMKAMRPTQGQRKAMKRERYAEMDAWMTTQDNAPPAPPAPARDLQVRLQCC